MKKTMLRRDERGFTLPELLVTMMVMVVVLFALYSIFDASIRIFSIGNDKVEATENARIGLERMERELRAAYVVDKGNDKEHIFFTPTTPGSAHSSPLVVPPSENLRQLSFGNELVASGSSEDKIMCVPALGATCEYITYKLTAASGNSPCNAAPCTLRRVNAANAGDIGDPVIELVDRDGLAFTLLKSDNSAPANEDEVGKVRITLRIVVDDREQVLTTSVDLRNRVSS